MEGAAATRAGFVLGFDADLLALEVRRQVAQRAGGRSPAAARRFGTTGGGLLSRSGGGEVLLDVLQGQLELVGIEALGLRSELSALKLLEDVVQALTLGLRFLIRRLEVIAFAIQSNKRGFRRIEGGRHRDKLRAELIRVL